MLLYYAVLVALWVTVGDGLAGFPAWGVAVLWVLFNALDAHTTILVTERFGVEREQMPVARFLMGKFGIRLGTAVLKIPLVALTVWWTFIAPLPVAALTLVVAYVAVSNYVVNRRLVRRAQTGG